MSSHKLDLTVSLVKGRNLTVYKRRSTINWETFSSVFSWRYKTTGGEFLRETTISFHCSLDKTENSPDETNKTIPITLLPPEQQTAGEVAYSLSLCFLFVLLLSRLRELTLDESLCSLSSKQYGSWTTAEFTYAVWPGVIIHECSDTSMVPNMCFLSLKPGKEGICWDYWLHLWKLQGAEIHWRLSSHEQWLSSSTLSVCYSRGKFLSKFTQCYTHFLARSFTFEPKECEKRHK